MYIISMSSKGDDQSPSSAHLSKAVTKLYSVIDVFKEVNNMQGWSSHMFDDVLKDLKNRIKGDSFGENVVDGIKVDIKVETQQPYLNQKPEIPIPVVKKGK